MKLLPDLLNSVLRSLQFPLTLAELKKIMKFLEIHHFISLVLMAGKEGHDCRECAGLLGCDYKTFILLKLKIN